MITKNSMQLKAIIKNKAIENNISAQIVLQNYLLERLLERMSLSAYKDNFILKGGFLIAAIVGLNTRATKDMDTTIKGFPLTHEKLRSIFEHICAVHVEDNIVFSVTGVKDIQEGNEYPGLRIRLSASYPPLKESLQVDVTTGDIITPHEIDYSFKLLFDERTIPILAYNLETILAEKLETILSRDVANTRPRDYYDIYILYTLRYAECNMAILKQALEATAKKRGSLAIMLKYNSIIDSVQESPQMRRFWKSYQEEFSYAKDLTFDDTCNAVIQIMDKIYSKA